MSPALSRPTRSLDEALADRLRAMAHWTALAKKRLDLAMQNPADRDMHIGAAAHFIDLANKGISP